MNNRIFKLHLDSMINRSNKLVSFCKYSQVLSNPNGKYQVGYDNFHLFASQIAKQSVPIRIIIVYISKFPTLKKLFLALM